MPDPMIKLCECGCGEPAPIAKTGGDGYRRGETKRYIRGHRTLLRVIWLPEDRGYETPCHIWQGAVDGGGYGLGLTRGGQPRIKAHRRAWMDANGPIPDGLWVLHKCDQPPCMNPDHLFLGTPSDNVWDKVRKGRANLPPSEKRWNAKLTNAAVAAIRADKVTTNADLARRYGIDPSIISRIRSGTRWKNAA